MLTLFCLDCNETTETDNEDMAVELICGFCDGQLMIDHDTRMSIPVVEFDEPGYYTCTHEDYPCCGC